MSTGSGRALSGARAKRSIGWYAGALAFWLLTAWLITVGLSSIIPQIFWPAGDPPSTADRCAPELRTLRRELLDSASARFQQSASEPEAELVFFERWDERHHRARANCRPDEQTAWRELARTRHGIQALLERFNREHAPRLEQLERLLGKGDDERAQLFREKE
jgi:hypothetical protein